jgi:hypothetical protein
MSAVNVQGPMQGGLPGGLGLGNEGLLNRQGFAPEMEHALTEDKTKDRKNPVCSLSRDLTSLAFSCLSYFLSFVLLL